MAVATVTGRVHTLTQAHPHIDCIVLLNTNPQRSAIYKSGICGLMSDAAVFSRTKRARPRYAPCRSSIQDLTHAESAIFWSSLGTSLRRRPLGDQADGGYLWGLLPGLQSEGLCVRLCNFNTMTRTHTEQHLVPVADAL